MFSYKEIIYSYPLNKENYPMITHSQAIGVCDFLLSDEYIQSYI